MNTNQIDSRFHHVIGLQGSWYLEAGLGLEGGEGARESGGLDEGGDGGDHRGPRAGGGGSGAAGPPSRRWRRLEGGREQGSGR